MNTYRFSITWPLDFAGAYRSAWTAPAGLRCNDLLLLYEAGSGGGRKALVAVGRAVTDSVRAERGDGTHWAWVDWHTVVAPLPYSDAQSIVKFSVRGPHSAMPLDAFERVAAAMIGTDKQLTRTLGRWRDGKDLPRTDEVPIRELVLASWYASARASEIDWYDDVESALMTEGWEPADDRLRAVLRGLRGPLTSDPDGGNHALRPDIVLMRPDARRVLVVEVKRHAMPTQGYRNPP